MKTHVSGFIGLLVIAFAIFAAGTLFNLQEYLLILAALCLAGVGSAFFFRWYFHRRSIKEEIHLLTAEEQNNGSNFEAHTNGTDQVKSSSPR